MTLLIFLFILKANAYVDVPPEDRGFKFKYETRHSDIANKKTIFSGYGSGYWDQSNGKEHIVVEIE
jgi:hypothetical protein